MQTILNHRFIDHLSPADRHYTKSAQMAAHDAAFAIREELEAISPAHLKSRVIPSALVGLTSAYGRILADMPDQRRANRICLGLDFVMRNELTYWRRKSFV